MENKSVPVFLLANGAAGGISSEISGGKFIDGARLALAVSITSFGIEKFTKQPVSWKTPSSEETLIKTNPNQGIDSISLKGVSIDICDVSGNKCGIAYNHVGSVNIDATKLPTLLYENSVTSKILSNLPGFNSGAIFHDAFVGTIQRNLGIWQNSSGYFYNVARVITNQMTIAPVIGANYVALGAPLYYRNFKTISDDR